MIYIKKNTEPEWLTEYKRRNPTATYDSESFSGYREPLRKDWLKNSIIYVHIVVVKLVM